ncbi:MAG TPA: ABC transporter permease [Candidatus Limnocylindrales bacterium]|nr:ABC transporter permease [Candidatus Limnocylindrales bacterium]
MIEQPSGAPAAVDRSRSSPWRSSGWGDRSVRALAALFALFLGLPVLALVVRAVLDGSLVNAIASPVVLDALGLSLLTTAVSLVVTVTLGLPLAYVLARRSFRGKGWLEAIVDLPIVLPPSVAGLALLFVFGRRGLLAEPFDLVGISIPFTTIAVILAQTFVSAPFFIRSARTGIAGVDRDVEDAARVDGASERELFRSITLPLASAALAAGLVMTWARSLGEFGATIMFAGNVEGRTQTLPLVVYGEFQGGHLDASVAAAAILVLAAFGVLVAVRVFRWGRVLDARGLT